MLKMALPVAILLFTNIASAQTKATTEDGRKVLLLPNGTWKYVTAVKAADPSNVPASATEKVEILRGQGALFYDPAIWTIKATEPGRVSLEHTEGDLYGLVISERMQVGLDALKKIALSNARKVAPDARIVHESLKKVNGVDILEMQLSATVQDIPVVYFGHYYAGPQGAVQVLTYTAANLFEEFKGEAEKFLNGFKLIGTQP